LEAVQTGDLVFAPATAQQTIRVLSDNDTAPPPLRIVRAESAIELRWSASAGNFKLESTVRLDGTWNEVTGTLDSGTNEFTYRGNLEAGSRFFRLN
ncbi:MAG: hypothetical protein ACXW32_13970, partial [Limisphaerales bacterium]